MSVIWATSCVVTFASRVGRYLLRAYGDLCIAAVYKKIQTTCLFSFRVLVFCQSCRLGVQGVTAIFIICGSFAEMPAEECRCATYALMRVTRTRKPRPPPLHNIGCSLPLRSTRTFYVRLEAARSSISPCLVSWNGCRRAFSKLWTGSGNSGPRECDIQRAKRRQASS